MFSGRVGIIEGLCGYMLYIQWTGSILPSYSNLIVIPEDYLDSVCDDVWFEEPFVKHIIKQIDGTDVTSAYAMSNPNWGIINRTMLSGGCSNMILAYKLDDIIIDGNKMGDNCLPVLFEISKKKDVHMILGHLFWLDYDSPFEAVLENTGRHVNTYREFKAALEELPEWWQ